MLTMLRICCWQFSRVNRIMPIYFKYIRAFLWEVDSLLFQELERHTIYWANLTCSKNWQEKNFETFSPLLCQNCWICPQNEDQQQIFILWGILNQFTLFKYKWSQFTSSKHSNWYTHLYWWSHGEQKKKIKSHLRFQKLCGSPQQYKVLNSSWGWDYKQSDLFHGP